MKRFIFLLTTIFICTIAYAHTINWWDEDRATLLQTTTCDSGESITPPTAPYKYGYHFKEWLPYSARIEYLESTGTQWIDTGIVFNSASILKIKEDFIIQFMNHCVTHTLNWGISGISDNNYNLCLVQRNWQGEYLVIDSQSSIGRVVLSDMDTTVAYHYIYDIDLQNNILTLTTNSVVSTETISGTKIPRKSPNSIKLFKCHDSIPLNPGIRIYNYKFYFNDTLIRDFIPVLDKDGVPCMYDKVEKKFYYNAGTGDFIAGPVIGGD